MKELKIDGVFDLSDEELWLKHIEEYPQIKTWSEEKREGARKGFISGLAEGRKEICKLCETKIKEKGKSCAYRSCGNEYCWEK